MTKAGNVCTLTQSLQTTKEGITTLETAHSLGPAIVMLEGPEVRARWEGEKDRRMSVLGGRHFGMLPHSADLFMVTTSDSFLLAHHSGSTLLQRSERKLNGKKHQQRNGSRIGKRGNYNVH